MEPPDRSACQQMLAISTTPPDGRGAVSYSGKPTYSERSWGSLILANSVGAIAAAVLTLWIGMAYWYERTPEIDLQALGLIALTICLTVGHGWSAIRGFSQIGVLSAHDAVVLMLPFTGWFVFVALLAL